MKITKFDVILNFWVALIISAVLSIALPFISATLQGMPFAMTAGEYFAGLGVSFALSFVLTLFIPIAKLGDMFAAKCGAKPFTAGRQLLTTIVLAIIMGIIMCLVMTWWGIRLIPGWQNFYFSSWISALPFAIIVIYICANISLWTGVPLTKAILGIPSGPPPEAPSAGQE